MDGIRRALVCCCGYPESDCALPAAHADGEFYRQLLQSRGYDVRVYTDKSLGLESPSKRNVLSGLQWLTKETAPSSSLVFVFVGHGTLVRDGASDSRDAASRALLCSDKQVLSDAEIAEALAHLPGGLLTGIFDCSFADAIIQVPVVMDLHREIERQKRIERLEQLGNLDAVAKEAAHAYCRPSDATFPGMWPKRLPPANFEFRGAKPNMLQTSTGRPAGPPGLVVVTIAASKYGEMPLEFGGNPDEPAQGVMTGCLKSVLAEVGKAPCTVQDVALRMQRRVELYFAERDMREVHQHCVLGCTCDPATLRFLEPPAPQVVLGTPREMLATPRSVLDDIQHESRHNLVSGARDITKWPRILLQFVAVDRDDGADPNETALLDRPVVLEAWLPLVAEVFADTVRGAQAAQPPSELQSRLLIESDVLEPPPSRVDQKYTFNPPPIGAQPDLRTQPSYPSLIPKVEALNAASTNTMPIAGWKHADESAQDTAAVPSPAATPAPLPERGSELGDATPREAESPGPPPGSLVLEPEAAAAACVALHEVLVRVFNTKKPFAAAARELVPKGGAATVASWDAFVVQRLGLTLSDARAWAPVVMDPHGCITRRSFAHALAFARGRPLRQRRITQAAAAPQAPAGFVDGTPAEPAASWEPGLARVAGEEVAADAGPAGIEPVAQDPRPAVPGLARDRSLHLDVEWILRAQHGTVIVNHCELREAPGYRDTDYRDPPREGRRLPASLHLRATLVTNPAFLDAQGTAACLPHIVLCTERFTREATGDEARYILPRPAKLPLLPNPILAVLQTAALPLPLPTQGAAQAPQAMPAPPGLQRRIERSGSEPHFPEALAAQLPSFRKDDARAQPENRAGAAKVLERGWPEALNLGERLAWRVS